MTIHQAVNTGDPLQVECVIDTRPDVLEHRNTLGRTALLQAAATGSLIVVKLLALKGANINARSYTTDNASLAIHLAAEYGHAEIVKYFLELAPEQIECRDKDGDTPLCRAAYNGRDDVIRLLISRGANIEAPGYRERTPLLRAAANGHLNTVKLLLEAGANPVAKSCTTQDFEKNAAFLAAVFGFPDTVEYLVSVAPDLATTTNIHHDTLLCYAALGGHVQVIKLVLENYCSNIETIGRVGRTPILQSASMGHLDAVKYLQQLGANVYARSSSEDDEQTILHLAARFGHPDVVEHLVKFDPRLLDARDKQNRTPYDTAVQAKRRKVIELLTKYK